MKGKERGSDRSKRAELGELETDARRRAFDSFPRVSRRVALTLLIAGAGVPILACLSEDVVRENAQGAVTPTPGSDTGNGTLKERTPIPQVATSTPRAVAKVEKTVTRVVKEVKVKDTPIPLFIPRPPPKEKFATGGEYPEGLRERPEVKKQEEQLIEWVEYWAKAKIFYYNEEEGKWSDSLSFKYLSDDLDNPEAKVMVVLEATGGDYQGQYISRPLIVKDDLPLEFQSFPPVIEEEQEIELPPNDPTRPLFFNLVGTQYFNYDQESGTFIKVDNDRNGWYLNGRGRWMLVEKPTNTPEPPSTPEMNLEMAPNIAGLVKSVKDGYVIYRAEAGNPYGLEKGVFAGYVYPGGGYSFVDRGKECGEKESAGFLGVSPKFNKVLLERAGFPDKPIFSLPFDVSQVEKETPIGVIEGSALFNKRDEFTNLLCLSMPEGAVPVNSFPNEQEKLEFGVSHQERSDMIRCGKFGTFKIDERSYSWVLLYLSFPQGNHFEGRDDLFVKYGEPIINGFKAPDRYPSQTVEKARNLACSNISDSLNVFVYAQNYMGGDEKIILKLESTHILTLERYFVFCLNNGSHLLTI